MTDPAFRTAFTPYSSGGSSFASFTMTVPAGVVADDYLVVSVAAITAGLPVTVSSSDMFTRESGSLSTAGNGFVFTATGHVAGDVLNFSVSPSVRVVAAGVAYSTAVFDAVGTDNEATGVSTVTAPGVTVSEANDIAVATGIGIATSARTLTAPSGWNSRTTASGGSGTRQTYVIMADQVQGSLGTSPDCIFNSSGSTNFTMGVQISLSGTGVTPPPTGSRFVRVAGTSASATRNVRVSGALVAVTRTIKTS